MNFLNFLLFLILSNAEPLRLDLDNSDLLSTSSPLLNSPLPDSLSLNLPASGNDPSTFNLYLNDIDTHNNPASGYSAELAQEPSDNGAGDSRESIAFLPSIIYPDTQTNTDDFDGICHPDSNSGQNRRKRESTFCVNQEGPAAPPILPIQSQVGGIEEKRTKDMIRKDFRWRNGFYTNLWGIWNDKSPEELAQGLVDASNKEKDSCKNRPTPMGTYPRPYTFCCLGPSIFMTLQAPELRLARRQSSTVTIENWFNCQVGIPGRPYCEFHLNRYWTIHKVCCVSHDQKTNPIELGTEPGWWEWGFKGVDCVDYRAL